MNNLWGAQQSIFAALDSVPKTYPVYDAVPQLTVKPYIVIGEYTAQPDEDLASVTTDATLNIHTWSNKSGKSETHAMLDFIRIRLDGQPIAGTWMCEEDFVDILEDPASTAAARLYHGIARYRLRVEDSFFPFVFAPAFSEAFV